MPQRRARITDSVAQSELAQSLAALRVSLKLPTEYPADATAEAAATHAPAPAPSVDLTHVPFVTIDPTGSRDLDQAMHLSRTGDGFLVRYAIADVPGWVRADGAIDVETRARGLTRYAPDGVIPLHPAVLTNDRVSLLPGGRRSAFVWEFTLDPAGNVTATTLTRAWVESIAKLDYQTAQRIVDGDASVEVGEDAAATVRLLPAIGVLRVALEQERGGASLNSPDEEIVADPHGGYSINRRAPLPVENWNAQLSLMTGMEAARLMLSARVGVLRTMPAPEQRQLAQFRHRTVAFGLPWPTDMPYGEYLRTLDPTDSRALAVLQAATTLFRGAGYTTFAGETPVNPIQAAVAAPYAHVTAPLRRLVDRWGLVICEAIANSRPVPAWALDSLAAVPELMRAATTASSRLDAEALNRVEAALLASRIGETFDAVLIAVEHTRGTVQIAEPPVTASCNVAADAAPGTQLRVRVEASDIGTGEIVLSLAAESTSR
ncbi:MAG TPA: RNB domain-containing ribonuclease [Candidatus Lumbricidophila sp.]|nr:RNB domain-containing ribonuclease [Candidatus Lumbricidophila sp.]